MLLSASTAETAAHVNWGTVILGLVVIICLSKLFLDAADYIFKKIKKKILGDQAIDDVHDTLRNVSNRLLEIEKNEPKNKEKIDKISHCVDSANKKLDESDKRMLALNEAIIEILYDRVSQRCRYYINELHGIPEDEVESFNRIFEVYSACGGNHGLGRKVEYCNNNLPILSPIVPKDKE